MCRAYVREKCMALKNLRISLKIAISLVSIIVFSLAAIFYAAESMMKLNAEQAQFIDRDAQSSLLGKDIEAPPIGSTPHSTD